MCTGSRITIARHHTPHSIKIITKGSTCVVNLFLLKKKTKPTIFLAATRVSTIYCWYVVTIVRLRFNICLTMTKSACLCMRVSLYSSSQSLLPFKLGHIKFWKGIKWRRALWSNIGHSHLRWITWAILLLGPCGRISAVTVSKYSFSLSTFNSFP